MYLVMALKEKSKVKIKNCHPPHEEDISLSFADGMVGVMPVFDTYEAAEKWADGIQIIEVEPSLP